MANYSLPSYDQYRSWIREARNRDKSWSAIEFGLYHSEEELEMFLDAQRNANWWEINSYDWKELVALEKEAEEKTKNYEFIDGQAMIMDENQDNAVYIPNDERSAWVLYKRRLLGLGFKSYVIEDIEKTTIKLLRRLSDNTVDIPAIKGLVIGNVQSGKTANMAALMAMAADWGWNMFIVLSGTIENLRQQTQIRLLNDLNCPGNLSWRGLEHLSKNPSYGQRAQDLHFYEGSHERYFTVCLKNKGRLQKLIQWLQSDHAQQRQMKILVIDDEADQAGINTADITTRERNTINKLIVNLVNGKNEKGKSIQNKYRAMNYIGYTATPYANVLNEISEESLYPRNFITTLGISKEYFGPQQIFGVEGEDYDGMNIVRIISNEDLEDIKDIHDGVLKNIPESLKHSLCWFLCCSASMRIWGYKKPISMLVHTSQKQDHHHYITEAIRYWLAGECDRILYNCKEVWEIETNAFTYEDFRAQYPDYDRKDEEINKYPKFEDLEAEVRILLGCISNIKLGEDLELEYHEGIHICTDNCRNNGINEDGMYVRLAYPDTKRMPTPAPTFIVIGGATLSRGLTLEGLISTFFLRSVSQSDTLMQMGRWFGYRKGYELLPRIWITSKTNDQFKFLSSLDEELRQQIYYMDVNGISPIKYGVKIKNTPKYSFIRITSKNKMQRARPTEMDFSGSLSQTFLFYNDREILKSNIEVVEDFIGALGFAEQTKECNKHAKNSSVWRNIEFIEIFIMLKRYQFHKRLKVLNDIESFGNWVTKITKEGKLSNWNVIISSKEKGTNGKWKLPFGDINKVGRTRKADNLNNKDINIGVLRNPNDIISDVDLEGKDSFIKNAVYNFTAKEAGMIRNKVGLGTTPQLIIYMIDKDSKASQNSNRVDLNAVEDILGLCINIPGGKIGTDYATSISIKLENDIFDDEGDLEGTHEN